jgi:hypothetical protein
MKKISFPALGVGVCVLMFALGGVALGHPPYALGEAFFLAAFLVILSAVGGFEWGFVCLVLQAVITGVFRDAWGSAGLLICIAGIWYIGATLLVVRGSRVLMGIAAGVLFTGLLAERIPSFSVQEWLVFSALLLLEVSGMYLAGNVLRGRWFSPYA